MLKILKFGGTSVGKPENLKTIFKVIENNTQKGIEVVAVFSALSEVTDQLIEISQLAAKKNSDYLTLIEKLRTRHHQYIAALFPANQQSVITKRIDELLAELSEIVHGVLLLKELSMRSLDLIMSFGERMATEIIAAYGKSLGLPIKSLDTQKIIVTDDNFGAAHIQTAVSENRIQQYFQNNPGINIVTGFIAATEEGITTTLGRGGSDYTASFIGAALGADEIQIWTDVNGVLSADPQRVKDAFSLPELSYQEAMELSHFGAKVIHPPTIQPALDRGLPIRIMNTFNPDFPGTLICKKTTKSTSVVKGITSISNISLLTIQGSGMVGVTGTSSRFFGALANANVNVILISQASSEHSICIAIIPSDVKKAKNAIEKEFALEIKAHLIDPIIVEDDRTIIAVVGEGMRKTTGLAGRLFNSLGEKEINVDAIAQGSSELNVSIVIDKKDEVGALNAIHEAFFSRKSRINLFIVGTGLVGSALIEQIRINYQHLVKDYTMDLRVVGLANIEKMIFDKDGIDLNSWLNQLAQSSILTNLDILLKEIKRLNLGNNVFVDCTASPEVVSNYEKILAARTSIVAANKLGNTGSYNQYLTFRQLAKYHNVHFLYETNAGAALPIISTLQDMINSGDQIIRIEAILSGTISYIFNNFQPGEHFSAIVKEAQERGFTEPDPQQDLEGLDFARKMLILTREAGVPLELNDIQVEKILPQSCCQASSVEDFFIELGKADSFFTERLNHATAAGKTLRYIAVFENNQASISLHEVDASHPFYALKGSDNIIAITTSRYSENPLVIKGAGAGAEVTAAGVMADIFKIANSVIKKRYY
jgi:aspartokinase/homoserine dehydrogenase 1